MCYSAQVVESFHKFIKTTGARMEIREFVKLYGFKASQRPELVIPRAVDRWFDEPKTMEERALSVLIVKARHAEGELLKSKVAEFQARKDAAEAKLATKATKTAEKELRVATNGIENTSKKLARLQDGKVRASDGRFYSRHYAPIILQDPVLGLVVRPARYLLRRPQDTPAMDTERPGCFNARRDNLDRYWRGQFGVTHALLPATAFYENVKGKELKFTPDDGNEMLIACLYSLWKDPDGGPDLLTFGLVTDDPPPEVAAAGHDRCPVNLRPENVAAWLTPEGRSPAELQALLNDRQRPYYGHEVLAA